MDYSRKISERQWNLPDKGERESMREKTFIDDIVQKSHIEKELLANLSGIETVFDGGAGCGRFSILLARKGLKVTHFDISAPMIEKAKEMAAAAGVMDNITFVQGALEDLSAYADRSFDLVMSFDAPISYTYPQQEAVIQNLVRIAGRKIMLSVSSRLGTLPYLANPLNKIQFILDDDCNDPWVKWCMEHYQDGVDGFRFDRTACMDILENGLLGGRQEIEEYERGGTPWPITYTFLPDELIQILSRCGVDNIQLAGPGAYARTIPREFLRKIMQDSSQREDFLAFCHHFDQNPYVCGLGKDNLFAKGDIRPL